MSFAQVLNQLMTENGDSNLGLSKILGVSDMAVAKWRKGESTPSIDNAVNIAKYYRITVDEVCGIKNSLESNKYFLLPILGKVTTDLIYSYGFPTGNYIWTTTEEIDEYPRAECYVIETSDSYLFVHQQKQCSEGDYVIYEYTDFISEYGIPCKIYSLRKFVKAGDMIELLSDDPKSKKVIMRKQTINQLKIEGVVINKRKKIG